METTVKGLKQEQRSNLPINKWKYVKPYSKLKIKSAEELRSQFGSIYEYIIELGLCGKTFDCSPDIKTQLCNNSRSVIRVLDTDISGDIITTVVPIEEDPQELLTHDITVVNKDYRILEKMKSLVDRSVFIKVLSLCNGDCPVNPVAMEKYIEMWAIAKYEYFLMFGGSLTKSVQSDFKITESDFKEELKKFKSSLSAEYTEIFALFSEEDLRKNEIQTTTLENLEELKRRAIKKEASKCKDFKFQPFFDVFTVNEYTTDKLEEHPQLQKYFGDSYVVGSKLSDFLNSFGESSVSSTIKSILGVSKGKIQKGMKVSKLITKLFKDESGMTNPYSALLGSITESGCISYSIDPIDYLLCSTNQHGWSSCMKIFGGGHTNNALGLIQDESTIIAYKHNEEMYDYKTLRYKGVSGGVLSSGGYSDYTVKEPFKWRSFQKREFILFDKSTCAMGFVLGYADFKEWTYRVFREGIEGIVSEHLGVENHWIINKLNSDSGDTKQDGFSRSVFSGYGDPLKFFVYLKRATNIHLSSFAFGSSQNFCLTCGKSSKNSICQHCRNTGLKYDKQKGMVA